LNSAKVKTRQTNFSARARRFFRRCVATPVACLLVASAAEGSTNLNWSLHVWQSDDGLPNNTITSLAQTGDGYLWIATAGNFARFDGVHFEEFTPKNILPGYSGIVRINALLEDSHGGLWIATADGPVICLNSGIARVYTNNLPGYIVQSMLEDGEGAIWITFHGSAVCRIKEGTVTRFTERDGLPAKYDCALTRDNQGRIWFAKDGQVGRFQGGRFEALAKMAPKSMRLAGARDGSIWVCSSRELFKCDDSGTVKSVGVFKTDASGTDPASLLEDKDGAVWIGTTSGGLCRYADSNFENVPTSHPNISCLLQDREGNIWAGTAGGGLDRIRPRAFTLEDETAGLPSGTMESVCEDARGTIWAVAQNGTLSSRTNGAWHNVSDETNWPGGKTTCVAADRDGAVWIGTRNRALICRRDGHYTTLRAGNGFLGHVVRGLLADTNGCLWVAEDDPGVIQLFKNGEWKTFELPSGAGVPRAMSADAAGSLWVGTSHGMLLQIHGDVLDNETDRVLKTPSSIRSVATTPDGSVWIGYAKSGLGRLTNRRFTKIALAQGLFDDFISQIIADRNGWLWMGSDHGIFKVRTKDLDDVGEGRATRVLSIHYGEGNGLPSLQASVGVSPNALLSHDNRLWFPTLTGLAVVNLNNLQENLQPPPVLLKQVVLDDRVIASYGGALPALQGTDLRNTQSQLQLPPGHRRLEFEFTAFNFGVPGNVRFQYRLAGLEDGWIDAGTQRTISYARLPAGDYQFQIRAQNGDGVWGETRTANLTVTPFFWQTVWFRSTAAMALVLAIVGAVRYVSFRRLRAQLRELEKEAALDKERSRIAKDIHDDLGGSLTQIKLLFELTQRKRTDPDKVDLLGQEGLAATRQIIKSLDEIVWAVNPRNDSLPNLVDYLGQFAIEFLARAGIRCRVDLPDQPIPWEVSPEVRHNLFLAVKEALNNVVLHAGANEVWLRIRATEQVLTIVIEDNGHGFERKPVNGFADGLPNMGQRLADIGGRTNIETKAGMGTRVSLIFPKPNPK
jgi:ligand-binding sensor domain-containing protein/signal transduction histidine kinase